MREIKFRYYDKRTKEMIYQHSRNFSVRLRSGKKGNEVYKELGNMIDNTFCPDLAELMQYTGLKDKNGKGIYEGDILKYVGHKCPCCGKEVDIMPNLYYEIRWDNEWAAFEAEEKAIGSICTDEWTTSMEVIGNIWENPELLE